MSKRKQINVRLDDDVIAAIEDIRAMQRPIPTASDVIRDAVLEKRSRMQSNQQRAPKTEQ